MRNLNKRAWDNLDDHERTALSLNHGFDKSTWQAGEIMQRSHYKYLEIKSRAEFYLKTFTEYFNLFNCLIPELPDADKMVVQYFRLCIEKRMKPKKAILKLSDTKAILRSNLNTRIEKQLKIWQSSARLEDHKTFNLVKDFDRWNNFRILPKSCQEPSAFKRRLKNVYKRQLKTMKELNPLSLQHLKDLVVYKTKKVKDPLYLPLFESDGTYTIHILKNKPRLVEIVDNLGFYYFADNLKAISYANVVQQYLYSKERSCQDGLKFWPVFRDHIKSAANYDSIHNKAPHRKFLDIAMKKIETEFI